ncbi:hypothetical protein [Schlesneria paludicola]|uniref:hypothetical protein n=1 Tax=Schlesneria paludicola TaxID=360056 RepID=UPI00029B19F9|nr:hypothetical protein [Schlesneria paludicola]
MNIPSNFVSGWVSDPHRVQDSILERAGRGEPVMGATFCLQHAQELPGTWERMKTRGCTGVFLRDREFVVRGKHRRPMLQRAGTCVSRGTCRGLQTSLDVAIADNLALLKSVELTFAPIYTLARHEVGKDRCGRGDGAILADAMKAVHDFGVATTELFPGLTEDQVERLAVQYAAPGVGTPANWLAACNLHTCVTFWPETLDLLCDCLAAGYAVPYAHSYITGAPNSKGVSDLGLFGPHCRCFVGVFLDENGETQLESSESWGRFPAGQPTDADQTMPVEQIPCINLHYAGGVKKLAPGDVGVNAKRFWSQIKSGGEAWAVGPPRFESLGIADLTRKVQVI